MIWTKVECLCGRTAAIPENAHFPLCGGCGRRMVAPIPPGREMFEGPSDRRRISDEDLLAELKKRGFPTEAQDWPMIPFAPGFSYPGPPWEVRDGSVA